METKSNNAVIQRLIELGLSYHEALIYVAVLKNGDASAGVVLDEVKLHREQVYRALKRLVDEGYLSQYEKRKRAYFTAVDPKVLVQRTKAKVALAEEVQPFLQQLRTTKPQIITVWEGEEALKLQLDDMTETIPENGEFLILGAVGMPYFELTKEYYHIYEKKYAKKHIRSRVILYEGTQAQHPNLAFTELFSVKTIPRPSEIPASTGIYCDKVAIDLLDPDNIAVITIQNKKIADSYRQTFEMLWK